MLEAQRLCQDRGLDFCDVFAHQYVLSHTDHPEISGWGGPFPIGDWQLSHCRKLDCCNIIDGHGHCVGWLLGVAVDGEGTVVSQRGILLDATPSDGQFWSVVERTISNLAGKYIAFLLTDKERRVYFDPVLDMAAVYNHEAKMVASSPLLTLRREVKVNPRIDYRVVVKEGGNYGLQNTCDAGVLRAVSNHYLDLQDFSLHRHWPDETTSFEDDFDTPEDAAQQIIARLGQITDAMIRNYGCAFPISGGNDSRTLVYAARDSLSHLNHAYAHRINWITKFDCFLGKKLAEELGLELQIVDAVSDIGSGNVSKFQTRQLSRSFQFATGFMKPPKPAELLAYQRVPESELVLRGNIMDMSRANQWPRESLAFDLSHAIDKLAIGGCAPEDRTALWRDDYIEWMETLPENAKARTYEFAFIEQLLPNTLGSRLMGLGRANYVNPFNDRGLITACMKVSPQLRKKGTFNHMLRDAAGAPKSIRAKKLSKQKHLHSQVDELFA